MTAQLAASALAIPHSRIRELAEIAMTMDGVLKLYFGESNIPTPEFIKRAARKAMADGYTFYTSNAGLPSTRQALARYYAEIHGVMVDPEIGKAGDLDTAVILLRFKNGVIGTIDNSRKAVYGYDQRVEILGSNGAISTNNTYPNQAVISTQTSVWRELPLHFFMERYTESFVNELRDFVEAVQEDKPVLVTGTDGRIPVVMGLAARKSYDEHRPVRLDEIEADSTPSALPEGSARQTHLQV